MRLFFASLILCLPNVALGQEAAETAPLALSKQQNSGFQLGGAAMRSATIATAPVAQTASRRIAPLIVPNAQNMRENTRSESNLGAATLFMSEGLDDGRDAVEFGTFLQRGQARAGVSVTYIEADAELARSELFVDYALTERFSVGVSGILDTERSEGEPVQQLGLNAEFATSGGTYVRGGIAGASDYDPTIGLSVGLRF